MMRDLSPRIKVTFLKWWSFLENSILKLRKLCWKCPYNCKYTSPDIQKEILSIFASKIRKYIREEIGDSKFSILVDETCDVAKREQMALVLRFGDKDGILQERFFDLIHVENTRSLTLKRKIEFYFIQPWF